MESGGTKAVAYRHRVSKRLTNIYIYLHSSMSIAVL
jgi:hypothetical protein